jgi:hypothetical protein
MEYEHQTRYRDPPPHPKGPSPAPVSKIVLTEHNDPALAAAHGVTRPVVLPSVLTSPPDSFRFVQANPPAEIHEFLFKLTKGTSVFWVGAAVPKGATDFTRAQVFFHPTVKQGKTTHAKDEDYRQFTGGWSARLQRYIALQGVQLAAAHRPYPMIVPFTTMAALGGGGSNMFGDRAVETLRKIMDAVHDATPGTTGLPTLSAIGVASFSSGIAAMRQFVGFMRSSGLVKEVIDLDGPWSPSGSVALTPSPGATSRCFTQVRLAHEPRGWIRVKPEHFEGVTAFSGELHAQIGFLMYHQAMLTSTL